MIPRRSRAKPVEEYTAADVTTADQVNFEKIKAAIEKLGPPVPRPARLLVGSKLMECIKQESKMTHGGVTHFPQICIWGLSVEENLKLPPWGYQWEWAD